MAPKRRNFADERKIQTLDGAHECQQERQVVKSATHRSRSVLGLFTSCDVLSSKIQLNHISFELRNIVVSTDELAECELHGDRCANGEQSHGTQSSKY